MTDTTLDTITVTLQRDAEGQFLNIPLEFELATNDVLLTKDGNRLIIETAALTNAPNSESLEPESENTQSGKSPF
jgi:virulence-associated protein VagC